ncbi:hypothetical protein PV411_33095 [Streptomyces sp. NRRL_B-16638]|jgi:hypothetical protein|uniref:hypothetical protein n=1 Tax=Streptomyces TaxID=1883 RepID=UPI0029BB0F3B|nr:hypothetical protein [Streptomyces sp. NRRL_B-16638]MDX2929346.1 hypothetical protein [Streptomyces sp. NRRL_B-16638]
MRETISSCVDILAGLALWDAVLGDRGLGGLVGGVLGPLVRAVHMQYDPQARDYVARHAAEGMSAKDVMRCLKRFVAREARRHIKTTAGHLNEAIRTS